MKLQHTAVIFILIAIPILLIVAYYMSLQIDTITLQTSYNAKLLSATKDALEAFEINSVEWNGQYEDTANNKRRNVEASINTFMNSLANNMKISGANKEYLEAYIPALMMNLYDGYYIYAPITTHETIKDSNGLDEVDDKSKIMYLAESGGTTYNVDTESPYYGKNYTTDVSQAKSTTEHTLLPFTAYSEQIGNITINYTLDNYVKIYGDFSCETGNANYGGDKTKKLREKDASSGKYKFTREDSGYVKEEGYLLYFDPNDTITAIEKANLNQLKYDGKKIQAETLTENVVYNDTGDFTESSYKYIYIEDSQGDKTKLYYDSSPSGSNNWFTVDSNYNKVYLTDDVSNVTQYVYKKVSLPSLELESDGLTRYINFYQVLNGTGEKDSWYADWDDDGELPPSEKVDGPTMNKYQLNDIDIYKDCSSIKYYVQAYYFTKWVNKIAENLSGSDSMGFTYKEIFNITSGYNADGTINEDGNDPGNPETAEYSKFYQHKNTVIQNQIMNSLAQAIHTYDGGDGVLPNLNAVEWEQILSNVSMASFMQGIPIGLKQYNGYAIATSTSNREYVDPNELYFVDTSNADEYYHQCYCEKKTTGTTYQGYRAIDFIEKSYTDNSGNEKFYYLHNTGTISSMECYYCLVNRANYTKYIIDSSTSEYNTALSRERYRANQDVILAKEYAKFTIKKSASNLPDGRDYFTIGDTITWTIKIENIGAATGSVYVCDELPTGLEYAGGDIHGLSQSGSKIDRKFNYCTRMYRNFNNKNENYYWCKFG